MLADATPVCWKLPLQDLRHSMKNVGMAQLFGLDVDRI